MYQFINWKGECSSLTDAKKKLKSKYSFCHLLILSSNYLINHNKANTYMARYYLNLKTNSVKFATLFALQQKFVPLQQTCVPFTADINESLCPIPSSVLLPFWSRPRKSKGMTERGEQGALDSDGGLIM